MPIPEDPIDRVRDQLAGGIGVLKRRALALRDFKNFIARGNALDLAIGVVIGAAFNGVVQSLVKDVLTPLVSIPGKADFKSYSACVRDVSPAAGDCAVTLGYGIFVTNLVSFLLTALAVFFFVVRPLNHLRERRKADPEPVSRPCPECLSDIPRAATRCSHCAIPVTPESA